MLSTPLFPSSELPPEHPDRARARIERTVDKMRRGGLPAPFTGRTWVHFGTSRPCSGCCEPVISSEREFGVELSKALTFVFHVECYNAWMTFGDGTAEDHRTPRP